MKKILIFLVIITYNFLYSQTVNYNFNNNGTILKFQLLADKSQKNSEWRMVINGRGDSISKDDNFRPFYKVSNEFYILEKTIKNYVFIKDVPIIKWHKEKDKKTILGYNCNSASTEFRGRTYRAYYTNDVPFNGGPWKFYGLNGLILSISSQDGHYSFQATKINLNESTFDNNRLISFTTENSFIDWNAFVNKYREDINDFINQEKCNCENDGKNILRISKMEKVYPELHDDGITY